MPTPAALAHIARRATDPPASALRPMTPRERDVAASLATGTGIRATARALGISRARVVTLAHRVADRVAPNRGPLPPAVTTDYARCAHDRRDGRSVFAPGGGRLAQLCAAAIQASPPPTNPTPDPAPPLGLLAPEGE